MRALMMLLPAVLPLAACGSNDAADDDGTRISIDGGAGENRFSAGLDKDGRVAIDVPGFKANLDLPKIQLDAGDFDINGVSLPAGSKISSMNLGGGKDGSDGAVRIAFASPVTTAAVRDWFQGKLAAEGFKLTARGDDLTGTTDDGKAFSLTTRAAGNGRSESVLSVGQ